MTLVLRVTRPIEEQSEPDPRETKENAVIWRPPDVFRVLATLRDGWWLVVLAPILGSLAAFGYAVWKGPTYEVTAQLVMQYGPELAAPATVAFKPGQTLAPITKRLEDATAELQMLKDPELVRGVVDILGEEFFLGERPPETFLQQVKHTVKRSMKWVRGVGEEALIRIGLRPRVRPLEKVVVVLQQALSVELISKSEVIELKLRHPDRLAGEEILKAFLGVYFEKRDNIFRNRRVTEFFQSETGPIEVELEEARSALGIAHAKFGVWMVDDQRRLLLAMRSGLVERSASERAEISRLQTELQSIRADIVRLPETSVLSTVEQRNPLLDQLSLRRVELELGLQGDRRRYGALAPEVVSGENKIDTIDRLKASQPDVRTSERVLGTNRVREALVQEALQLEASIAGLRDKGDRLDVEIANIDAELNRIDLAEREVSRLERNVERLDRRSIIYQAALDEAKIATAISEANISNMVVMARPQAGIMPVAPRLKMLLLVAVVLSLGAAVGFLLLFDALNPKLRTQADIAAMVPDALVLSVREHRK